MQWKTLQLHWKSRFGGGLGGWGGVGGLGVGLEGGGGGENRKA